MNLLAPVSKYMTSEVITLAPTDEMTHVKHIFDNHNIHHIPVTVNHRVVGIVSKSDFLSFRQGFIISEDDKRNEKRRLFQWKVSDIMTKGVAKVECLNSINFMHYQLSKKNT
jgi:CBS-domain-containing membrane protein